MLAASLLVAGRILPADVRRPLLPAAEFEQVCRAAGAQPQPACECHSGRGLSHEMPPSTHDRPRSGQTLYTRARRTTGVEAQSSLRGASKHAARRTLRHAVAQSVRTQNIPHPNGLPTGRVALPATQSCPDPARQMIHMWRSTRRRTCSIYTSGMSCGLRHAASGVLPVSLCMDRRWPQERRRRCLLRASSSARSHAASSLARRRSTDARGRGPTEPCRPAPVRSVVSIP